MSRPLVYLAAAVAASVAALGLGADVLTVELPGGLPVGNVLAVVALSGAAAIPVLLSRPGTRLRAVSVAVLAGTALWFPASALAAGNLSLEFTGSRGPTWMALTALTALAVLGTLGWGLAAATGRRLRARSTKGVPVQSPTSSAQGSRSRTQT